MAKATLVACLVFNLPCIILCSLFVDDGGWCTNQADIIGEHGPCNIQRRDASEFSQKEFLSEFAYKQPVIITNLGKNRLTEFRNLCTKEALLENYSDVVVRLNSANTYSYTKVPVRFSEYLDTYLKPQKLDRLGNETLYLFGDINADDWQSLLSKYKLPQWQVPNHIPQVTLGIAGAGTGVPFHFHGPAFAEVVYGRKRWFLYPPDVKPEFDPDNCTLHWYTHVYPTLLEKPYECLLEPNEMIYFPNLWWHSTLNVDTALFISIFVSP